jgi:hypothetical protein
VGTSIAHVYDMFHIDDQTNSTVGVDILSVQCPC